MMSIPEGFRQGTKSISSIPDGFRQGTEPMASIPDGYRQGTEPTFSMPEGFRQGTEPMVSILDGFRQGTEPMMSFPEGFRQGTEHSSMALGRRTPECKGKIIMGRCYQFNPTPLSFKDAQVRDIHIHIIWTKGREGWGLFYNINVYICVNVCFKMRRYLIS